jgi:predicted SnoaL-like aldol condensation-catalyzing enzyme
MKFSQLIVKTIVIAALLPIVGVAAQAGEATRLEQNKELVFDMWQGVITNLDEAAVMRYIAPNYKQHNPNVAQGRQGLLEAVRRSKAQGGKHSIKRLIATFAEGDLVVLVWDRDLPDPKNPGQIYTNNAFDMFRVERGMVVEHWDDAHKNP